MGEQDWEMLNTALICAHVVAAITGRDNPHQGVLTASGGTGQRGMLAGRSDDGAACVGGRAYTLRAGPRGSRRGACRNTDHGLARRYVPRYDGSCAD